MAILTVMVMIMDGQDYGHGEGISDDGAARESSTNCALPHFLIFPMERSPSEELL